MSNITNWDLVVYWESIYKVKNIESGFLGNKAVLTPIDDSSGFESQITVSLSDIEPLDEYLEKHQNDGRITLTAEKVNPVEIEIINNGGSYIYKFSSSDDEGYNEEWEVRDTELSSYVIESNI